MSTGTTTALIPSLCASSSIGSISNFVILLQIDVNLQRTIRV
jgi:hypothetical protein